MSNYPFLKQKIVNANSRIQDLLSSKIIKKSLVFTNGEELYYKYISNRKNTFIMRSSTVSQDDILKEKRNYTFHNPIQILTVAVFSSAKGSLLIPEVIFNLSQIGILVHWHYIGKIDGNAGEHEYKRTMDKANKLGVAQYFIYHGSKSWDELPQYYENADIFVLPTYAEGIPRVLLEAQAHGLPVVTTTVGGIPQAIRDGQNGILVPPGNAHLMANAIYRIVKNKSLFDKLVDNGVETAKELCLESETKKMMEQVVKFFPSLSS
jgi:glycosyltransferase involved in cell wall biosynthesis